MLRQDGGRPRKSQEISMSGERDLVSLQKNMAPRLNPGTFVFCNFSSGSLPGSLEPICTFRESEGLSAIVEKRQAERMGLQTAFESRMITLTVHSSLDAVGFLATITAKFASADIPCNVVSAFHHDHLFVPAERASLAMDMLISLTLKPETNDMPA